MTCPTLEIGSIIVPQQGRHTFEQEYEDLQGLSFNRVANGNGILRNTWSGKISTTIIGRGWAPSAFANLATGTTHVVKCAIPRAASSNTTTVTLPASRRSDPGHTPRGWALVDAVLVETTISGVAGDDYTLDAVAGAQGYRVTYFPQITAAITVNEGSGENTGSYEWRVQAEEI